MRRGDAAAEGLDGCGGRGGGGGGEGFELAEAGLEAGGEGGVVGEVGGVEPGDLLERDQVRRLGEDGVHGGHLAAAAAARVGHGRRRRLRGGIGMPRAAR